MQQHVKLLGILHIILGALGMMAGLLAFVVLGGIGGIAAMTDHSEDAAVAFPVMALIGVIVLVIVFCVSVPGLICGWGLMQYHSWARILGIVLSVLELLNFPFGTALGVYGLWVLLKPETEVLFRRS